MLHLANAFSLSMLGNQPNGSVLLECRQLDAGDASHLLRENPGWQSAVGHPDTAAVFTSQLGLDVVACRTNIQLLPGDTLIVGQYSGPRLPEGATKLPEGARIDWWTVSLSGS